MQKLYYDALDDTRIVYRWTVRDKENEEMEEAKAKNETYKPFRYKNYYCPLNFWVRYKFRADTSHEVSALFVIFAFVPKLR